MSIGGNVFTSWPLSSSWLLLRCHTKFENIKYSEWPIELTEIYLELLCCLRSETNYHTLGCPQAQHSRLQQVVFCWDRSWGHNPPTLPTYNAIEYGIRLWQEGDPDPQWPSLNPLDNDPIDQSIPLAYTRQSSIAWSQALCGHLCHQWIAAMSTFMLYRVPFNTSKPFQ